MTNYEYEFRLKYLKGILNSYPNKKVTLYGAGKHTQWLLGHIQKPIQIIDESSELIQIQGVNIIHPVKALAPEIIFISSDTQEAKLKERAKYFFPNSTIIAPYEKIGIGPFLNKSYSDIENSNNMSIWKNKFAGKRCFIVGNGPSLNKMDLSQLANEYTFGANRLYLLFKEMGFETSFLTCVNPHVIEQFQNDFHQITCPKFFAAEHKDKIKETPKNSFFFPPQDAGTPCFHKDLSQGLWWGATVTYVSMQLAFYMGFQEVYLIGVDHSFKDKGEPNKLVKFDTDDENHFSPEYFKGSQWQLPDLDTSELAYRMAKLTYSKTGRFIKDATIGGHLNVFEKVDYNSLF